jgi:uncharacterized protein YbaR (Trm112 family)
MAGKKRKKRSRQFDGGARPAAGVASAPSAGTPLAASSVAETASQPAETTTSIEAPSDGARAPVQARTERPEQRLDPSLVLPQAQAPATADEDGSPDRGVPEAADGAPLPDRTDRRTLEMLICPLTKATLEYDDANHELISRRANLAYPIRFGVPLLTREAARSLDEERRPVRDGSA